MSAGTSHSLLSREVSPVYASLLALIGVARLLDALLHLVGAVWIGRYLGIPGSILIMASTRYSLRKRKIISRKSRPGCSRSSNG